MAINFDLIKFGLGFANVPSADVDALQANSPALARLVQTSKDVWPLVEQAEPHVKALEALWEQAAPHIAALMPLYKQIAAKAEIEEADVTAVLPMFNKFAADIAAA